MWGWGSWGDDADGGRAAAARPGLGPSPWPSALCRGPVCTITPPSSGPTSGGYHSVSCELGIDSGPSAPRVLPLDGCNLSCVWSCSGSEQRAGGRRVRPEGRDAWGGVPEKVAGAALQRANPGALPAVCMASPGDPGAAGSQPPLPGRTKERLLDAVVHSSASPRGSPEKQEPGKC